MFDRSRVLAAAFAGAVAGAVMAMLMMMYMAARGLSIWTNPNLMELSPQRTMLAAVAYALASYPVVVASVMVWANPLFVERTHVVPMTIAHAVFGLAYGATYLVLISRTNRFKPA